LNTGQRAHTSQLAEIFQAKFRVNSRSKCDIYKFAVSELTSPRIVKSTSYPERELTDHELACWRIVWLPTREVVYGAVIEVHVTREKNHRHRICNLNN